jgi:hypothetical protein
MSGSAARGGLVMVRTSGSRGSVRLTWWRRSPADPDWLLTTLTVTVAEDVAAGSPSTLRNGAVMVSVIVYPTARRKPVPLDSARSSPQPRWIPHTVVLVNGIIGHPLRGNGVPGALSWPTRCGSKAFGQNSRCRVITIFPAGSRTVSTVKLRRPWNPAARLDGSGTSLTDPPGPRITRVIRIGAAKPGLRRLNCSGAPRAIT